MPRIVSIRGEAFVQAAYLCSAFFRVGRISIAKVPPIRAVISWGQVNMAGSIVSILGARRTVSPIFLPRNKPDADPQMTSTTKPYRIPN